ncbi:MAG: DUF1566 domain-containing protein [Candidatus Nitrohelix vancouverensis]|uniref:DUF1566 domain-containing protein n=1 Tax=Candidatus Nitrohelix vancouverensis TaxID=2705534 RepID=A0A7T0C222_9BACT|nr:MAG: DUF1566 domain-containing protein [Candidatus Nitrohelix vancouverensis]
MQDPVVGKDADFIDNGDGTISDPDSGLMWMKQDTWLEKGRLLTWHESQDYAREINEQKFAGYSNWRVPTRTEAKTLFDINASNTDIEGCEIHLDPLFPSGCGFSTWTSETRGAKAAMGYDLRSDYEFWLAKENSGFPSAVRLVRRISKTTAEDQEQRFVNNKDGTVTDNELGLMWKADDSYLDLDKWVSWEEGKTWVKVLNQNLFAKYTDWRLPTRKEAQSIYDPDSPITDKYGDVVYLPKAFPPGSGQTTWTKTLHRTDRTLAIRFQFYNGDFKWHKMGLRSHGVRAVRDIKN